MKSSQNPETYFVADSIKSKLQQKESNIKPLNIDSSALMFSIKHNHGFNAKDRKRFVDKEKEAQLKNKRRSFINHMYSSNSVTSDMLNSKSGNLQVPIEVGYIRPKKSAMQLNNYAIIDVSE